MSIEKLIENYIAMNVAGQALELIDKHYAEDVLVLNGGEIFASSRQESCDKQKGFIEAVASSDNKLVSSDIDGNVSTLVFRYQMVGKDGREMAFTGRHVLTWKDGLIVHEAYETLPD
ncbi:MAG: nuclear transport factor 2 family protein [Cohaesibacteraceae bacterium]|nr:nuclear transport factor 2 family protein [Cohaesibacteraceae bacterium]